MILIVGAGLAGLSCAKVLVEAGQEVRVIEAADHIGGRVYTDHSADGFLLDRGFQVLFTAYPAARRQLDYAALKLKKFAPGATLIRDGHWYNLSDPMRNPFTIGSTLANPLIPFGDKLRTLRLRRYARRRKLHDIFYGKLKARRKEHVEDRTAYEELRRRHFSDAGFIDAFARPFFGGIFLNRELDTSARMLNFVVKMLASGDIAVPEQGIGAITDQLAAYLPPDALRLETRVEGIVGADGRAVGVTLTGGEEMQGDAVVIATDGASASRLLGHELPIEPVAVTCVYFGSIEQIYKGKRLLLNTNPDALINNAVQLSNISPAYAPKGQHLFSTTVLGDPPLSDAELTAKCREEIATWFPGRELPKLRHLATYRIRFAQFRQPPGIFTKLPENTTPTDGLFLAGEYTASSSINGAIRSGESAAKAVLDALPSLMAE